MASTPRGPTPAQIHFRRALGEAMRREWVTEAIVAINVAVFVLMALAGVPILLPSGPDLVAFGANYPPLTLGGEPWRLVTAVFVHGGLLHLGFNMYALLIGGRLVERVYGHLGFTLLYLFAGLCGSVASVVFPPWKASVGASGAIFGVFGALLAFLLRRRALVPPPVLRRLRMAALAFVAFNVAFGFAVPGIDNAAHLGGLSGGFFAGLLIAPRLEGERLRRPWVLYALLVAAAVALPAIALFAA